MQILGRINVMCTVTFHSIKQTDSEYETNLTGIKAIFGRDKVSTSKIFLAKFNKSVYINDYTLIAL
jgi:hypothetical protein